MLSAIRLPLATVAAIVVLLALAGCSLLAPGGSGAKSSGPTPTSKDAFYSQALAWQNCGTGLKCTTVKAPIDWANPAGGAIDLAVVKHPANKKSQGSLLVNPGGPGGSGWDFVFHQGATTAGAAVMDNFDVVGWDPRGVGKSTPVVCYTDPKDTDQALYGTFDAPYDSQAWIDELAANEAKYAAACKKNTGELLGNVDTASNARDMDMLRAVLGNNKLNYLGYSYGTYFGTVYAELFPENVGRFVLDGAVDPLASDFESLKFQMAGFDNAYRAYMTSCLDSGGCPFTGTVDEALAQTRAMLSSVDDKGIVNGDGRKLDVATLATAIIENLYSESYWPDMTTMLTALQKGDASPVFKAADDYNSRSSDGSYSSNGNDVYVAASCVDGDFASDKSSTLERIAEIDAAAPILGKFVTYDDFAVLDTACSEWPYPRATLPTSFEAKGAGPILVIGTTNDPATPYAQSVSLAKQLSSGVLITHKGEGHTVYNQGVACIDDLVNDYFVNGTVPAADPMC